MADPGENIVNGLLAKLGASSLIDLAEKFPNALNKDVYIRTAEKNYEEGKMEEAFHNLSQSHSTLLHQHMYLHFHKASLRGSSESGGSTDADALASKMSALMLNDEDEAMQLLQKLPSDWTVVQITPRYVGAPSLQPIGSHPATPELYIARCSCGPKPSVTVQTIPAPRKGMGVRGILQEVELIKGENRIINKDYRDQQEKYWKKREELDNRLRSVVRSVDVAWLRYWCCLLVGGLPPREQKLLDDTIDSVLSATQSSLTKNQVQLLKCLVSCPEPDEKAGSLEGGTKYSLQAGIAAITGDSVRNQQVKKLNDAIKQAAATLDQLRQADRNPVILILDKSIVSVPWEMIWVLRNRAVTRMPSLRMLSVLYQHHVSQASSVFVQGVNPKKAFYVLDPDNNLPRTQKRLKSTLTETGWQGVTAQRPTHEQFKEALTSQDMFVYVGHGSGSQYMPGEVVEGVECRAVVLLYGCSSVRLSPRGRIPDPWGVVLNYLIAYCPCVIGMLWDVTDKDTDKLTLEMLRAVRGENGGADSPLETPPTDLPLLVSSARSLCSWYLTAAALSVYGLPLHIVND